MFVVFGFKFIIRFFFAAMASAQLFRGASARLRVMARFVRGGHLCFSRALRTKSDL